VEIRKGPQERRAEKIVIRARRARAARSVRKRHRAGHPSRANRSGDLFAEWRSWCEVPNWPRATAARPALVSSGKPPIPLGIGGFSLTITRRATTLPLS